MRTGYRTESFAGSGYRSAAEVMAYETFELGNRDIPEYLIENVLTGSCRGRRMLIEAMEDDEYHEFCDYGIWFYEQILDDIYKATGHAIKYALWLCDRPLEETIYGKYMLDEDDCCEYIVGEVLLSDLGPDGQLWGYCSMPEPRSFI